MRPTDADWFAFLSKSGPFDEVNFWSPGGASMHAERGTPLLFKLKSPVNAVGGGGFIDYSQRLTIREAWEYYGIANGVPSLDVLLLTISKYVKRIATLDDSIGCTIVSEPTFLSRDRFVAEPEGWPKQVTSAKYYAFADPVIQRVWRDLQLQTAAPQPFLSTAAFGGTAAPLLRIPRRGQGTFRRIVLTAYGNQCAVTGEHTIPVLQASHIKPFAEQLEHEVQNGIALRSDVHTLFDRGYVTVTKDHRFLVSDALRHDFANGKVYYKHNGESVRLPDDPRLRPNPEFLEWHADTVFKG